MSLEGNVQQITKKLHDFTYETKKNDIGSKETLDQISDLASNNEKVIKNLQVEKDRLEKELSSIRNESVLLDTILKEKGI